MEAPSSDLPLPWTQHGIKGQASGHSDQAVIDFVELSTLDGKKMFLCLILYLLTDVMRTHKTYLPLLCNLGQVIYFSVSVQSSENGIRILTSPTPPTPPLPIPHCEDQGMQRQDGGENISDKTGFKIWRTTYLTSLSFLFSPCKMKTTVIAAAEF